MTDPTDFYSANALLTRNGKPVPTRKVANNTYCQRRGEDIAIKFHDTDVVTYRPDDTIVLDSGGWITTSTKDRMNRFTPHNLRVDSMKGRWLINLDGVPEAWYGDGMVVSWVAGEAWGGLDDRQVALQDAHNKRIEKLVEVYLAHDVQPNDVPLANCGMCVRTGVGRLVGDAFEDKQHLIDHLIDKRVPRAVWLAASEHANPSGARMTIESLAKADLRKYLRQQLYVGPVATAHGKRPAHTPAWRQTA